jgi:glycosyltransferase involved in cell wall biosynthesis
VTPAVSVVVPLHDGAATIQETLEAVRAQTFTDWELLVVDDASADDGPQRVAAFPEARLLPSAGTAAAGPAAARNRGLAEATGALVAFLDADDVWEPGFLAARVASFEADPDLGLVWGPAHYWYADGSGDDFTQDTGVEGHRRFAPGEPLARWLQDLRGTPCPSATVFRRDAVAGYPEELRRGEDIAACLLVAADHPTAHDPAVLVRYRRHGASATSVANAAGNRAEEDLAFGRWAVSWARSRPEPGLVAAAARTLHGLAHRGAVGLGPLAGRLAIGRTVLATPGARRRWWAVALDGVLPLRLSRRVVARVERAVGHDAQ